MPAFVRTGIDRVLVPPMVRDASEEGQALIEYGMVVGLLSVVSILILTLIGSGLAHVFHAALAVM